MSFVFRKGTLAFFSECMIDKKISFQNVFSIYFNIGRIIADEIKIIRAWKLIRKA